MDFHNMKRKELQALCKKYNIPANLSNSQLALNLSSLLLEKVKLSKHDRTSSKASVESVQEKDFGVTTRQSKKVRFSPNNEMFEYVELSSVRKVKTRVTQTKSAMKPAAKKKVNPVVEKVDVESSKEVVGKTVRSLRSRVQASLEGGVILAENPPVEIRRARRVGKEADTVESVKEIMIKTVRVTRSKGQTSTVGGLVPASKQQLKKKRSKVMVKDVERVEPVEEVVGNPVRVMRSRAQTSVEGAEIPGLKPQVEKKRGRGLVKDFEPAQYVVDGPVRTTRFRAQTSGEGGEIPAVEKKRGRGLVKDVEPAQDVVDGPVRTTRSRVQTSVEGGEIPALKPQVEKKRGRGLVEDVKPAQDVVDGPVRTTRSRAQISEQGRMITVLSSPVEKKRSRTGMRVGDRTVKSTVADSTGDLPLKRSLRKREVEDADLKGVQIVRQKNQKQKTAKGIDEVIEDEPLATDGGITGPEFCLRRSTRNAIKVEDSKVLNSKSGESKMVGRGNITRSRNQLALKENSDTKTEAAAVVQRKSEVVLQTDELLGRTSRNANRRKSVMHQETENGVKVQGVSEVVPKLEEPARRPTKKGSKRKFVMPNIDEIETAEPILEKGDILKENEMVVPPAGPLRRSRRQTSLLESTAPTDEDMTSCVIAGKKGSGKQSFAISDGKVAVASAVVNNTPTKQRGEINLEEQAVDIEGALPVEESSRRFTRSATKGEKNAAVSLPEKGVGKKKQQSRAATQSSLVATQSAVGTSAIKEQSEEAQFSLPEVTESSTDLVSRSNPVSKDSSTKKRSEWRSIRSSRQEGIEEVFAETSIVEEDKGGTSASRSKRFKIDGGEKDKEISVRKQRGDPVFKEVPLEKSSKHFTRSATKCENKTELRPLETSAGKKKLQNRSTPPKLVVDGDSGGNGPPCIDAELSKLEVFKSPSDWFTGSPEVIKDRSSKKSSNSSRSAHSSKQDGVQEGHAETFDLNEAKGQSSSSKSGNFQTYDRQERAEISVRKERGDLTFEEVAVEVECAPTTEESSRRLTRSAFKSERYAAANLTVGKKKFLNRSATPKLEMKMPSADRNSAISGLVTVDDAQLSLPEVVGTASGPAREVINESSSELRKKVNSSAHVTKQDGTAEVYAQTSNIREGKDQTSNLEETLASKSERLQIDDIEKERVVSINETVITEKVIIPRDEPLHTINAIVTITPVSELGLPNSEMEVPLEERTSAHCIYIVPEVLESAVERSIEIEFTLGQESVRQFTGTAGTSKSESPNLKMAVPLEEGTSALEGASSTADVPKVSGGATGLNLRSSDNFFEDNSSSRIKKSSTGPLVLEEGSSEEVNAKTLSLNETNVLITSVELSALESTSPQDARETEMEHSVGEAVHVAENVNISPEVQKEKSLQCSVEMVNEEDPGAHSLERSGLSGSNKLADQEALEDLRITADALFDGTTSTAVDYSSVKQSDSQTKVKEMHEASTSKHVQPSPADGYHLVGDNGVNDFKDRIFLVSEDCNRLAKETTQDSFVEDYLLASNKSGGLRENDEEIVQLGGRDNQDSSNLSKEGNHNTEETGNSEESVKPCESRSSPSRQSIELKVSFIESSRAEVIGSDENTFSWSSEEPRQHVDGMVVVSTTKSFSIKQKSSVKNCNGSSGSNKVVDLVAVNLEKAQDFNLQTLQSKHKVGELDLALENPNSNDYSIDQYSDYPERVENPSKIWDEAIPGTVGLDDIGFENKMECAAAEDDFTFFQNKSNFVESSELDEGGHAKGGENAPSSSGEIYGSGSLNRGKNNEEIAEEMFANDGKDSDWGVDIDDTVPLYPVVNTNTVAGNHPENEHCDCGLGSSRVITLKADTGPVCIASAMVDANFLDGLHTPLKNNDENELGTTNRNVMGYSFNIQESKDTVPAEESQHEECLSKENHVQITSEAMTNGICSGIEQDYQLQKLFETPATRVDPCEKITSGQATVLTGIVMSMHKTPSNLGDEMSLQGLQSANIDKKTVGEGNAVLTTCEDIPYGGVSGNWHEDTLQTRFATQVSSSNSSEDTRSYGHEEMANIPFSDSRTREIGSGEATSNYFERDLENEMVSERDVVAALSISDFDGDGQDVHISAGSPSVDAGGSELKDALSDEKARTFQEFSDGLQFNHKDVIEENYRNSSISCQTSHKHLYGTEVITTDQKVEADCSQHNLINANHACEHRMRELKMKMIILEVKENSSVPAEEQPGEPEDDMTQIHVGTSDGTLCEDDGLKEGFDVGGDTADYFDSEHNENYTLENFDGNTQDKLLTEVAGVSGHEYSALDESGTKGEVVEAETSGGVEGVRLMVGQNCEEREQLQSDEASSVKKSRTDAPTDMSSRIDPSSVSDDFAIDEVQREKPDAKAEEDNNVSAKRFDSTSGAAENNNVRTSLFRGTT